MAENCGYRSNMNVSPTFVTGVATSLIPIETATCGLKVRVPCNQSHNNMVLGASYMIKTHYSIEFLRPSFFHIVQLWRQLTQVQPHMRGKASLRAEKRYNGVRFGELGMADWCQFGVIAGFR